MLLSISLSFEGPTGLLERKEKKENKWGKKIKFSTISQVVLLQMNHEFQKGGCGFNNNSRCGFKKQGVQILMKKRP